MIQQIMYQQDDIENRSRSNNIRIRGIPESVDHKDLAVAVTAIFNQLQQKPKDAPLELDRVHRTSGQRNPDSSFVRDTLSRVNFYKMKEEIMGVASTQDSILFNDIPVMLLLDLSHQTLAMRRALKLLTQLLQEHHIKYQWRFPFQLQVHHEGKTALFCILGDLKKYLCWINLFPSDPKPSLPPRQKQDKKKRRRSSFQRSPDD